MSNSQRIKHEGTYSTWKIHWLTRGGHRDGCLLRPIRVERLPRNFNVLKKLDSTSANLVAGRLMTHRSRNTSISSENYPPTPIPPFSTLSLCSSLSLSLFSYFTSLLFPYRVPRELRRLFAIQIDLLAIFRWKPICTCSLFILRYFTVILNPYACRFVSNCAAFFAYFSFIVISHLS